ncbi:transporter substrate-binding domain-containing protein [Tenuibacillus multivorans]|uniref:Polar amino acid transport system substrate-binding protein n=1 Tax=Tenuibacillus multivorans TaxID=237069 RepID=A0A1H0B435_9BACI|nr:transporter substrate-binding domain-containing protein [Tenuibacillus multivorans]GEL77536.1 ABC transporter substrate-binding protein [Tenuibacillus multivorans]SDN40418.1 polar amino acid transport system substrate-binding protein [Tenuibacillus multivorans]
MLKKGMVLFLSIFLLGVLAACGTSDNQANASKDSNSEEAGNEDTKEIDTLTLGTSADFPPFESFSVEGEFEGFDIDLAHLIAEELGYELQIKDMKFDGLIGALQSDRVDMVMAGMSATEKRQKNVDFSTEYHYSGEMFVTGKDSEIQSLEDLEGKKVGVQLGTIQQEGAETLQEDYDFELQPMDEATYLIQELKTGRIDVAYMDKTVAEGFIEEQDLAGFDDPTTSSPGMAVAFPKDSELEGDVSAVIDQFLEDGTIAELEAKWGLDEE